MIEYLHSTVAVAETIAEGNLDDPGPPALRARRARQLAGRDDRQPAPAGRRERASAGRQSQGGQHGLALTALPNRRALMHDLEDPSRGAASRRRPLILALFDLNGFKQYNDTFGHPAGDALLHASAIALQRALEGSAVRLPHGRGRVLRARRRQMRLAEQRSRGEPPSRSARRARRLRSTAPTASRTCRKEAASPPTRSRVADQRMYERKAERVSASRQSTDVLLKVLSERSPGLREHIGEVAQLSTHAREGARAAPSPKSSASSSRLSCTTSARSRIPETILNKPGPLDEEEWEFMHRHTVIGERIITAAPSLAHAAELVRSHHERYDGAATRISSLARTSRSARASSPSAMPSAP